MSQCRLSFAQILRTTLFTLLLLGMLASRAQAQDYILQGVSATQASYNAGGNAVVEVTIQNLSPATPPSIDLAINPTNTPAIAANWGFTSATGGGSCTPSFTTPYFPNSTDFQCNLPQGATGVFTFTATSLATPAASPETYNQEIQLFGSCGSVDCGPLAVNFDVLTAVTAPPVVGLSSIRQFREDSGTRVLVFSRSGDASAPLSFQLNSDNSTAPGRATPGDDFSPISTSISWAALDSSDKTLVLPILDDDIYEGDERFRIIASNLSDNSASFSFSPAIDITILDNEIEPAGEFNFSSANYRVNENGGNITISVERSGGGNGPVAVDYASADDSAVDGEDYSSASGSLSWADGEQGIKTFSLAIHSDILNEANESFSLQLSKPSGNALLGQLNQASVTIINVNDAGAPQVVGATINAIDYDGDGQVVVPLNADGKVEAESAIASISWSLGGSEIASGLNTSASFSLGEHTVRLTATDSNGKQAAVNYLVKVSSLEAGSTIRLSDTPGLSPTQGSVAQSLDSLCPRLAELSQVGGLSQGQANLRERCDKLRQPGLGSEDIVSALDQIGGEEVEALVATAARFSHVHLGNLRNRFTKLRSGRRKLIDVSGFNLQFEGGSLSGQVFADAGRKALGGAASADEQPEILRDSKLGLFINGNIAYKEKDSEAERAGFELAIQAITAGVD
ncbi:MAG: hypothetical protein OIF38_10985, partial [Cellvibrionaceae bacterium]|nr:hypothetical protein [Cellvibrionaceae bacterium]